VTTTLLPDGPHDLTVDWLVTAFERTGRDGVDVRAVEVTPIGTGQTGATYRLAVDYARPPPDLPPTFVVKLPSQDPTVRATVAAGCLAEVAFYNTIAPTVRLPLPTCYLAEVADGGASFVLLLSDLAPMTQGDQLAGCSPAAVRTAALALAGLHGPLWCDPDLLTNPAAVMGKADEGAARGLADIGRTATDMFLDRLGPRLTADDRATLEAYADHIHDWLLLHPDRFSLLHGDYRLDNLMFSPDERSVAVVDWQTLAVGLPARDLAYLVSTSLPVDERRAHEADLVGAYHDALGEHGVEGYSLDDGLLDYRIGLLQVPFLATLGTAFSKTTERGDEMMLTMVGRALPAMRDLGSLELVRQLAAAGGTAPR
jgi:hypothetical protein